MENTSVYAALIGKWTISNVTHFRYGQQIGESRVFEFRFKPKLSPHLYTNGTNDFANYTDQPITLILSGALGKSVEMQGVISKIDYLQTVGQDGEIFVTGTLPFPSGYAFKFFLFLTLVILLPLLSAGYFLLRANTLKHNLVSVNGNLETFEEHPAKGAHIYTFKLKQYPVVFHRRYEHTPGHFGWPDDKVIADYSSGDFNVKSNAYQVQFYLLSQDEKRLSHPGSKLLFFDISNNTQQQGRKELFYDLLEYVVNRWDAFIVRMLSLFIGLGCFFVTYSYYKKIAPDNNLKYAIPYWATVGIAIAFYFVVVIL